MIAEIQRLCCLHLFCQSLQQFFKFAHVQTAAVFQHSFALFSREVTLSVLSTVNFIVAGGGTDIVAKAHLATVLPRAAELREQWDQRSVALSGCIWLGCA